MVGASPLEPFPGAALAGGLRVLRFPIHEHGIRLIVVRLGDNQRLMGLGEHTDCGAQLEAR